MKLKFRHLIALVFVLGLASFFWPWLSPNTRTFFDDISLPFPSRYIVSHESPFWLLFVEDNFVLKIPSAEVASVRRVLEAQESFENVDLRSPRRYADFRSGLEKCFPQQPRSSRAGRFEKSDAEGHRYFFKFLFDEDDRAWTYLYLHSKSPTN